MNGELYLLILAMIYSFAQSSFLFNTLELVKSANQTYAQRIVNQQTNLIAYCSSGKNNCQRNTFTDGYIPANLFMDELFSQSSDNSSQIIASCYNDGYVFSFFLPNNGNDKIKFGYNEQQVFSYATQYSLRKTVVIDENSTFYKQTLPDKLCATNGRELMKKDVSFLLVNYVGN